MDCILRNVFSSYNVMTGIELGIGDHTERLYNSLGSLTSLVKNTELYHKYRPPEFGDLWMCQHYFRPEDISTFFHYFEPEYDLAVITCQNFQECLTFFMEVGTIKVPYIISRWNMGNKIGYVQRVFHTDDYEGDLYFYFRDITEDWSCDL